MQVQLINILDLHLLRPRLEFFNLSLAHGQLVRVGYVMPDPNRGDFNLPVISEQCDDTTLDKNDDRKLF